MRIVIALGGNAMTGPDGRADPEDQRRAVEEAAGPVADLVATGHEVVLTHGNGPQVGNLLQKNELAAHVVPPVPLDWCGAQTQGTLGTLLLNALDAALASRGSDRRTAVLVSRTLVDPDDPGFREPTKPIGRWMTEEEAQPLREHGQRFTEVEGRGSRRVVASPEPLAALDAPAADVLLAAGFVVVCSGGGGVPTVRREDGSYAGVEAVIDKDLTAALVATHLAADLLVIATDVEAVELDRGTAAARPLGEVTVGELRRTAAEQRFAAGSMGPKVEAVARFVEQAGGTGVITSLHRLAEAVAGETGTRVQPDPT
ncbi:MAG: Carbamate kinase [uncultured Nocardioidaceae bacterium]|uniref:Carbamate kinase n=1 Tax=uncultured Nocardioidaceae bacterium TaxID=253824 RepID=A0A6J4L185_9ACTN|nr:MAG: Carbamate kinase [uncultured Nocardioidaceae bacterium]